MLNFRNIGQSRTLRRLIWALLLNFALLAIAAGLWAWFDFRYVSQYRTPAEMRRITGWLFNALPPAALVLNFFLFRRLQPEGRPFFVLATALTAALLVAGAAWGVFHTFGVRFHLAIGGSLS